ncbi:tetratricopeptide repeat protein, partial [Streptomyces sp. NPDC001941]|uniref:tetratricopeptide repeat protein n=1 Tax=Streptomyces sp. NPDC001941 TaxID=3154659 RepID=UPI00332B0A58
LLDFYLATAASVYAIERPGDRLIDHLEPTTYQGLSFQDRQGALDWLRTEIDHLPPSGRLLPRKAVRAGVDTLLVLAVLGWPGTATPRFEAAATELRRLALRGNEPRTASRATLCLAYAQLLAGEYESAKELAFASLSSTLTPGDPLVRSHALSVQGTAAHLLGSLGEAEHSYAMALDGFRNAGDVPGEARVLREQSRLRLDMGHVERAVAFGEASVARYETLDLPRQLADARISLGNALYRAGRIQEALGLLHAAHDAFATLNDPASQALVLCRIAEAELASRRPRAAASSAEAALTVLGEMRPDQGRSDALVLLGRALDALGQTDRARACWREVLRTAEGDEESPPSPVVTEARTLLAGSLTRG